MGVGEPERGVVVKKDLCNPSKMDTLPQNLSNKLSYSRPSFLPLNLPPYTSWQKTDPIQRRMLLNTSIKTWYWLLHGVTLLRDPPTPPCTARLSPDRGGNMKWDSLNAQCRHGNTTMGNPGGNCWLVMSSEGEDEWRTDFSWQKDRATAHRQQYIRRNNVCTLQA